MIIMGEAMCEWKKSVYGKSLYLLLNFAVNLKLFKKKKKKVYNYSSDFVPFSEYTKIH